MITIIKRKTCDNCKNTEEITVGEAGNEKWFTMGSEFDTEFTEEEITDAENYFKKPGIRKFVVPIEEKKDFCSYKCMEEYLSKIRIEEERQREIYRKQAQEDYELLKKTEIPNIESGVMSKIGQLVSI